MADILIGLGGTGGKILKAFRQRLWTEFDKQQRARLPISFIYVDTDNAMLNPNDVSYETIHGNCCFQPNEFVDIKTHSNVDAIFSNPQGHKKLLGLLGNVAETQTAVCPVGAAADQKRRAGRILFASNIDAFLFKLASSVQEVNEKEVGGMLNIHLFAGLAGGTGSGSVIDAIAQTRKWLFEHNYEEDKQYHLTVFCQLPENTPPPTWNTGRYKANGYGALLELNNLFTSHYNAEWGNRTAKPCYDVSSDVDFARLYLSYDAPTADNLHVGRIPAELKVAGGLILYSNKNDYGHTVTEPTDLARLVADFVYAKVFLPRNDQQQQFERFYSFENITNFRDEYDETADPELGSPLPVRTRAIGSFGIKRVIVPETAMQEHIVYTLGLCSLFQMKYNNWSNASGYRDEPNASFAPLSYINKEGRLAGWLLSEDHLRLKKYVLDSDRTDGWLEGEFSQYWEPCIDAWGEVAKGADHSFNKLVELCRSGYEQGFRDKGVEKFYSERARSIVESYSRTITAQVEVELFKAWKDGKLALNQIVQVLELLTSETRKRATDYVETEVPTLERECRERQKYIDDAIAEYLNAGALKRPFIFKNRYERVMQMCKQLYVRKTEVAAIRLFAQPLANELVHKLSDLTERVTAFEQQVDTLIQFSKERMVSLSDMYVGSNAEGERDGMENMTLPIIEFYSRTKLSALEQKLRVDQDKMTSINESLRSSIIEALQCEERFTNVNRFNYQLLSRLLLSNIFSKVMSYHNMLCVESKDKVLGVPILERLQQKYGHREEALAQFARQLVVASGIFTELDMTQIQQHNANTVPPVVGQNILMKRLLVSLPKAEDPGLIEFANELKSKLESSIPGGTGASVNVSMEGTSSNEISIISMVNGYPMRAISSVKSLKAEYNRLVALDPKNKIVLLGEGRDGDYRDIFAVPPMTPAEERELFVPYLILLHGLDKILFDADKTEEYGLASKDFFGNLSIVSWGHKLFTDIPYDDQLVHDKRVAVLKLYNQVMGELFQGIDAAVANHVAKLKKEINDKVMACMGAIIKNEAPARARYTDFVRWTEAAIKKLQEYKPEV